MEVLALRFNKNVNELRNDIAKSTKEFAGLAKDKGATVEIYHRVGDILFSLYRFDNRAVMTMFSHRRSRTDVPTFVVAKGSLFDFLMGDLEAIIEQSQKLDLDKAKSGLP